MQNKNLFDKKILLPLMGLTAIAVANLLVVTKVTGLSYSGGGMMDYAQGSITTGGGEKTTSTYVFYDQDPEPEGVVP